MFYPSFFSLGGQLNLLFYEHWKASFWWECSRRNGASPSHMYMASNTFYLFEIEIATKPP